jgi:hypothetical protein
VKAKAFGLLTRSDPIDYDVSVAPASLAIFAQMRDVAREILQAKIALEARQRRSQEVARCCPDANVKYVHMTAVSPET